MKYVCSHFQGRANVQSPTSRLEAQVHGGAADKGLWPGSTELRTNVFAVRSFVF